MRRLLVLIALVAVAVFPLAARATESATDRQATLDKVGATLTSYGMSDAGITFTQSTKNKWNYKGLLATGLTNAQSLEVVIGVSDQNTINVSVYPHYRDGYINIAKSKKAATLMRTLLEMNDRTFFFWGADETNDVFACYKFTLESGYPEDSIRTVLGSIPLLDKYVGEFTPYA
jgi:hypothetical protein